MTPPAAQLDGSSVGRLAGTVEGAKPLRPGGEVVKAAAGRAVKERSGRPPRAVKPGRGISSFIPPRVYHGFSDVDDHVEFVSVRPDPDHVLPAGYVHPLLKK
jgi:hypothetical protein